MGASEKGIRLVTYQLKIKSKTQKKLMKMDPQVRAYLISFIEKKLIHLEDPRSFGKALKGDRKGLWRYRAGSYKIIVDIRDKELIILYNRH